MRRNAITMFWRWLAASLALFGLATAGVRAAPDPWADGLRFVSIAFHDVVDDARELDGDAITTDQLIVFFEWLRADGWTAITLDDVLAAHGGQRPLPAKAILLSFDDGYRSLYTRVWPLARAYRMPVVAALVGRWMDGGAGSMVRYGDQDVPRERFIGWDEAREMQRSGWVEFASHSFDLHRGVTGNPQGNQMPAATTAVFDAARGYESDAAMRQRLRDDLERSASQMQRELGVRPRAMVWPFGRYGEPALQAAREAGFRFALTLDPAPASATRPLALARFLPTDDPRLGELAPALRFASPLPAAQRWVCVDAAASFDADPQRADLELGALVERLRALGATAALIDPLQRRPGQPPQAWFPTPLLPVAADWLSRLSWQLQTRAGVQVWLKLPGAAELPAGVAGAAFAADLARHVPMTGLLADEPGLLADAAGAEPLDGAPWRVAARREAVDRGTLAPAARAALDAFDAARRHRPELRLALLDRRDGITLPAPARWADLRLATVDVAARPQPALPVPREAARRVGWWHPGRTPPQAGDLAAATRALQVAGGTAIGYCADDVGSDSPAKAQLVPAFSASTFPLLP
jgi:peptidoglycan/xylan/chitin deacetylase (PgdA/CDA1 family)